MKYLVTIVSLFILLFSCNRKASKEIVQQEEVLTVDSLLDTLQVVTDLSKDTVLYFSKSGCFGSCPVYSFLLTRNKEANYFGRAHVENLGNFSHQLEPAMYDHFIDLIENAQLSQYNETYPASENEWIVDLPTTSIRWTKNGISRHVTINHSPPESLKVFINKLEENISELGWPSERAKE